ncbi:hypothetical protein [Sinorhizobium sp. NFACC03]|uniref:hypothetical protein n=1 Tax=Sinorhizobium sp. NFACC03 TaxID=1566295 RepID=UPI00087E23D0|nr:hypothetical protein [Sinorhizobium sp. NFACC03]SDA39505.1 hypothetical protein SAMN03159448_00194 [Sinorhizobium sp. NFACC03]
MYSIENSYNPMMEALHAAMAAGTVHRSMAAIAWWLGRQQIMNEREYWFQIAGRVTAMLPAPDRDAIVAQLGKQEDAYVDNPVSEWPDVPPSLAGLFASWDPVQPAPDLAALRADAIRKIDREAEKYRRNFITPGSGQVMAYQQKLAEARAAVADPPAAATEIPHIVAEAAVDGVTVEVKATEIIATFEQWQTISAGIEAKRLGAKKAVTEAATAEAIHTASNVNFGA